MQLRRVQIPDYRVLQGVDLTFDAGLSPQVFPLGSENGGGKSTLLQLVFVLLHCTGVRGRDGFVRNIMASFDHPPELAEKMVAVIELWDGENIRTIEFVSLSDQFLRDELGEKAPKEGFAAIGPRRRRKLPRDLVQRLLVARGYAWPRWYPQGDEDEEVGYALAVRERGADVGTLMDLLRQCRRSIFLLAPSSQPFLFLTWSSRQAFVRAQEEPELEEDDEEADERSPLVAYLQELDTAAEELPGFFAYDWISVDALVELFGQARDRDFADAVKAGGKYGTAYPDMLRDVNTLLRGKRVRPLEDLSGVEFIVDDPEGNERILGPEDLSRGELKRLMIFAWLKANATENAIVLMDEIEISFHPDWQYRIVRDLVEWAPTAQFVLATHSHEVCQAVTPAHVRELAPVLTKRADDGASP